MPGPSRGEGGEDLLGATHADLRIGVRGTDLRAEVQVHEQLGESGAGEAGDVVAALLEGALQPWPVVLTVRRRRLRLAHPHHTAAHEPQRVWIAAGLGRRLAYHVDRFINTAEVNAAAAHPAVGEPTGAAQRRQGGRTKEDRRMRSLHG